MLTFIRGPITFFSPGQIYVKRLPDGEPVQLTNDAIDKLAPQFLPDGLRDFVHHRDWRSRARRWTRGSCQWMVDHRSGS